MNFPKEFSNKQDNYGLTPLLLLAHRLGRLNTIPGENMDIITNFVDDFITKCHCDVYVSVGKENQDEKVFR